MTHLSTSTVLLSGLLSGALLSSAAHAAPLGHEVSLELGGLHSPDPAWQGLLSWHPGIPSQGIRVGYGVQEHVTVVASYHHGAQGGEAWLYDEENYEEENDDFGLAFYANMINAGPKLHYALRPWLVPYATAQVIVFHSILKIDDNVEDDDNTNQFRYKAVSPGGMITAGLELRPVRLLKGKMRIAHHLEGGYGYVRPLEYEVIDGKAPTVGDLDFRGFTIRFGTGVRF